MNSYEGKQTHLSVNQMLLQLKATKTVINDFRELVVI